MSNQDSTGGEKKRVYHHLNLRGRGKGYLWGGERLINPSQKNIKRGRVVNFRFTSFQSKAPFQPGRGSLLQEKKAAKGNPTKE